MELGLSPRHDFVFFLFFFFVFLAGGVPSDVNQ